MIKIKLTDYCQVEIILTIPYYSFPLSLLTSLFHLYRTLNSKSVETVFTERECSFSISLRAESPFKFEGDSAGRVILRGYITNPHIDQLDPNWFVTQLESTAPAITGYRFKSVNFFFQVEPQAAQAQDKRQKPRA